MQLILAIAFSVSATGLLAQPHPRTGPALAALMALLLLPFAGLRFGGWPGVVAAFVLGTVILVIGFRPARVVGSPI